jgi:uncharacterized protein (TIGR02145 family)
MHTISPLRFAVSLNINFKPMKTIIKSSPQKHWLNPIAVFFTCLLYLVSSSCDKIETNQDALKASSVKSKKPKEKQDIVDIDGNIYYTVKIGKQVWMAENLKTTKYQNGDLIGTTSPATLDISSETAPKYQWAYNGDENNVATLGRLYTFYAITDSRGVCPVGWHIPSNQEWTTLTTYLGGTGIAGGKLKETGTTHWLSPNTGATNETGFTAIPAGMRTFDGYFSYFARWWSATEAWTGVAYGRTMNSSNAEVYTNLLDEMDGYSVRCVKD